MRNEKKVNDWNSTPTPTVHFITRRFRFFKQVEKKCLKIWIKEKNSYIGIVKNMFFFADINKCITFAAKFDIKTAKNRIK